MLPHTADERRSARANVVLGATIECEGTRIPVRLANLSAHGALVLSNAVLPAEAPVVFQCNGSKLEGWVAWSCAPRAGIQFSEPIKPGDLLRKATIAVAAITRDSRMLDFRRPGFRGNQLTDTEKRIVEEWQSSRNSG